MPQYILGRQPNELLFKYDSQQKSIHLYDRNNEQLQSIDLNNLGNNGTVDASNIKYQFRIDEEGVQKILISKQELGITSQPQFDILNSEGYNITTDIRIDRRWNEDNYEITMKDGWVVGTYCLKSTIVTDDEIVQGPKGQKGDTPQKGVDYWTEQDKAQMKSYIDEKILNGEW